MTMILLAKCLFFFFNDTATTEIYTLSLHDALPIYRRPRDDLAGAPHPPHYRHALPGARRLRSEEHTSELQSHLNLVCRLLLEKKKLTFLLPWPYTLLTDSLTQRNSATPYRTQQQHR